MINKVKETEGEEVSKTAKKRIHNPKTGRYYQVRQRSSTKGRKGTIMGTWSPPKKSKKSRK